MELIRRKISLETLIDRNKPITNVCDGDAINLDVDTIDINIFLTQDIDDMGIFTDFAYEEYNNVRPNYTILTDKLNGLGLSSLFDPNKDTFVLSGSNANIYNLRLTNSDVSQYYSGGTDIVSGLTESNIFSSTSYNSSNPFNLGLNLSNQPDKFYSGVIDLGSNYTGYTIDTKIDGNTNLPIPNTGIDYKTYNEKRYVYHSDINKIKETEKTEFTFKGVGWSGTNTTLSANTKEDMFFGVIFPQEVKDDVFIDRGVVSVFEPHLRLSEIKNLEHLERYGNGYYNIIKLR